MANAVIQRRVFVSGQVQGVGFRAATERQVARVGGIRGFVRNLSDGRVEAVFCGQEDAVLSLVAWCRKGPSAARVWGLEVQEESPDPGLPPFSVTR